MIPSSSSFPTRLALERCRRLQADRLSRTPTQPSPPQLVCRGPRGSPQTKTSTASLGHCVKVRTPQKNSAATIPDGIALLQVRTVPLPSLQHCQPGADRSAGCCRAVTSGWPPLLCRR
jgi:hypothetical protein